MSLLRKAALPASLFALVLGTALPDGAQAQAPGEADPYSMVRAVMGSSRDQAGKALCEQHIKVVQAGLPDPGRTGSSSRFAATAERAEMLQMLWMKARTTNDPSEALANVLVLVSMLHGQSYPEAVTKMIEAEAAQPSRGFDCERSYATQTLAATATDYDVEKDRQHYFLACSMNMSETQLRDEQSWALDRVLTSIDQLYGEQLTPMRRNVGATSGGDGHPPRYIATWRDSNGKEHTQPLTGDFLGNASKALTSGDTRKAALNSVDNASKWWNAAASAGVTLGNRFPRAKALTLLGVANTPDASILGTLTAGAENLSGALSLMGKDAAALSGGLRALGWVGLVIEALSSDDTMSPTQEGAGSLSRLHPDYASSAQRVDVLRSQEALSKVVGSSVTISESPENQSQPFRPEEPPLQCPADPGAPTGPTSGYVSCDETQGRTEPVVPAVCRAVMEDAERQVRGGYEWAPDDDGLGEEFSPHSPGFTLPCDDSGRNPMRCTEGEPVETPISGGWDGMHWDQDSETARGQLGQGLEDLGNNTSLPNFNPDDPMTDPFADPTRPRRPGAGIRRP